MNLAGIFSPTPIFPALRVEPETIVLSPTFLKAASDSKQKSLGFNYNFHLFQWELD